MAFRLATAVRNLVADAVADAFDGGAGPATIDFRTGGQPTNVGDSDTGTLLGTATCSDPAFGAAATGVVTANAITSDTSADASGTCQHVRIKDSSPAILCDADAAQGSGTFNFDNNVIVAGGTIAISSFTITCPIS